MARTIDEIYNEMVEAKNLDQHLSGLTSNSATAIWRLIFYVVAVALHLHERIFDSHKAEVTEYIDQMKPHSLRWYVEKVKQFRFGHPLIDGTDQYSDEGFTEEQITQSKIVHYASVSEDGTVVYIKVATNGADGKQMLSYEQQTALEVYIAEVKDAGVRVDLVNLTPNVLKADFVIFYDPMVLTSDGTSIVTGKKPVKETIKQYIENLPFDGELRTDHLVDVLQQTEGVVIPEIVNIYDSFDNQTFDRIVGRVRPAAGYYSFRESEDKITIDYRPYEND